MAIVLGALVVETVANLMANDRADSTKVLCRAGLRGKERWLQNSRREGDVVDHRIIKSVDGLRVGVPLFPVRRGA